MLAIFVLMAKMARKSMAKMARIARMAKMARKSMARMAKIDGKNCEFFSPFRHDENQEKIINYGKWQ